MFEQDAVEEVVVVGRRALLLGLVAFGGTFQAAGAGVGGVERVR